MKRIRGNIFEQLSKPLSLLIIFSVIFMILVVSVILKTRSQHQSLRFQSSDQFTEFEFVRLNTTTALCLDGSPGGYYISKDGDPNKVILFFEGGGWCYGNNVNETLQNCYERSKTSKGSTIPHPQSNFMKINQGILSKDPRNNFKDWKKVMLIYCDGSGHQGTKFEPVQVRDTQLYFRGYNITTERLNDLEKKIGLFSKASEVVVSGCSAGGLAAFHWANYITQRVKNGKVHVIADSGIFFDSYNINSQSPLLRQQYKTLMQIVNRQIDLPVSQCLKANLLQKQKCMFAQNIIGQIKAPVFAVQGLYDQWSVFNILGIKCLHFYSQRKCNPVEKYVLQENRRNVRDLIQKIKTKQNNGAWAPACSLHCFTTSSAYYNQNFRIPSDSQNSVSLAIQKWLKNSTNQSFYIDEEKWPSNSKCSGTNYFV